MFVVKATQSFTQLATKAIVVLVLIFHLKKGKWNIDIEMGLSQILILILILKWNLPNIDIDFHIELGLSQILILILKLKWNSAKFWFWFWYWNGTCQILILIFILNWDSAKYWFWFWNWNGTRPNIDFDIEMGLAKYWFWYWIAKPDIAHVPKGYPFCMLISAFKYGCMGPWPHTMAVLPVHHYKVMR